MSLFYYAVNQFREEEYVECAIQEQVMTTRYYSYEMFDRMLACTYQTDTLRQRCSYVLQHFFRLVSYYLASAIAGHRRRTLRVISLATDGASYSQYILYLPTEDWAG